METLIRAVTEDHAVALITFTGMTAIHTRMSVETILLPVRHNGSTQTRLLGAMTAIDEPYWFGVQPVVEQRITGLRLIWPDDAVACRNGARRRRDRAAGRGFRQRRRRRLRPMAATVFGRQARRYAHLAVIDGGRQLIKPGFRGEFAAAILTFG